MKSIVIILVVTTIMVGGGVLLLNGPDVDPNDPTLISSTGIHWHPQIQIRIHNQEVTIPANIGLGAIHNPLHTHDEDGIAHMEFGGVVREDQLKLGNFFKVWGEQFNSQCIFENCNDEENTLRMIVNGEPSEEFENYLMRDGDVIEIIYE